MKEPEKIYITPHFQRRWFTKEIDDVSVEYTRTDAFIEKACAWLKENGGKYWMDDYDLPTDELVSDFRSFMEGE